MNIAVDIGGTFTDIFLFSPETNDLISIKISSDPKDPSRPFWKGMQRAFKEMGEKRKKVQRVVHATTVVTNALLEGRSAGVGLMVTEGFEDILEIGRQVRPDLYDLSSDRLPPLVPRDRVAAIEERMTAGGTALKTPGREHILKAARKLKRKGAQTLAVVFLFSFLNPGNEEKVLKSAGKVFGRNNVFLSSRISPEIREYERASTTVIAAAVAPVVAGYLDKIGQKLNKDNKERTVLDIMHSGGGTLSSQQAVQRPHCLVESGPAAGILASAALAGKKKMDSVIAFDMGGTSAKAGLVLNGSPLFTPGYEVGGGIHAAGNKGKGYPVQFPMIDVAECGAGAGSIARVDPGGHLKVGPESAGADPGPVCYGRGGRHPTVTDALAVLGILDSDSFLGGEMELDIRAAEKAVEKEIARPLNMDLRPAAQGILRITLAGTIKILRLVSTARGFDPRSFSLMAYGGAGPLFAASLAEEMDIKNVVIPPFPGLFSACGLMLTDRTLEFVRTAMAVLKDDYDKSLDRGLRLLRKTAEERLRMEGEQRERWTFHFSADARYSRQNYELNIPVKTKKSGSVHIPRLVEKFNAAHKRTYGYSVGTEPVQVVNLRLRAVKSLPKYSFAPISRPGERGASLPEKTYVWTASGKNWGGRVEKKTCPVWKRENLPDSRKIRGPAVIREKTATTFVPGGWTLDVDSLGCLNLSRS